MLLTQNISFSKSENYPHVYMLPTECLNENLCFNGGGAKM